MQVMTMNELFAAVGCNNASQCLSRAIPSRHGDSSYRIAFGASTSIAIASFASSAPAAIPSIVTRLHGHPARISSAGNLRLHLNLNNDGQWISHEIATCTSSISAVNSISTPTQTYLLAATSVGEVLVYTLDDKSPPSTAHLCLLPLGQRHIVETLATTTLNDSDDGVLVALGGVDLQVHLYKLDPSAAAAALEHVTSLAGAAPLLSPASSLISDVMALTFGGQIHRWAISSGSDGHFAPVVSVTGHTQSVSDVVWSVAGDYFVTVSQDQTARAFAHGSNGRWTEISRVQVHGYDLHCGCFVDASRFVSGADEKILRVFAVPEGMAALVRGEHSSAGFGMLPELSLTTKATTDASTSLVFVGDQLNRSVWPELQKLYGHGNELLCVTSNSARTRLASACKSRDSQFAAIWLWASADEDIVPLQQLPGHASSVVQLAFSPDDRSLVSVSKDRHVCVYALQPDGSYSLATKQKVHKRIVWTCGWAHDSRLFATGSRDDTMILWGHVASALSFSSAVTAVAFAKPEMSTKEGTYVIAVGLESGWVHLVAASAAADGKWEMATTQSIRAHAATVTRLAWHPTTAGLMVSTSQDTSVVLLQLGRGEGGTIE
ncbi:hypothetical protein DYB35_008023 [Aphanomyces astaci]|uniref:Elongator complex protein 2 n=2 Tax=Aphanomyces astaci TaxID=112090 RepID=A0A3R7EHP0_APHAT|nr:hypothetical protein DYB35_008023 [Aphanomyces astaci]